jgi:RimJ/RimL family protein N-acetyltransferase
MMQRIGNTRVMGHPVWPLFDLEVRTPSLTLRYVDDDLAVELTEVAERGVHDPATMPFAIAWTDLPSTERNRQHLQFFWRTRADLQPESWNLEFAVIVDGRPVGTTGMRATEFPALRTFGTGSWLGREFQGRGIGKEMRLATLTLGFDGLGAEFATTGAWSDNGPSLGVTRSLGYDEVGRTRALRRGEPDEQLLFRMGWDRFATIRRDDIMLHGVDAARELLGIPDVGPVSERTG